jgi:hypothetical protein
MNDCKNIKSKTTTKTVTTTTTGKAIIVATAILAVVASAAMITMQTQGLQQVFAQSYSSNTTALTGGALANKTVMVNPSQTTNKVFWINTVHLDGATSLHAAVANPLSAQNTPLHPAETPPAKSTIPTGGGFIIVPPNKVGSWDFRSFTFAPDQIVVNQGDKVTLHFIGVQGVLHMITVDGVGTFALHRGEIYTVSFIANNPGSIRFWCSIHQPNMVGEILVLPKSV